MAEEGLGHGLRQLQQLLFQIVEQLFQGEVTGFVFTCVHELFRIAKSQPGRRLQNQLLLRAQAVGFSLARELANMEAEGIELVNQRTRIACIQQQQIEDRLHAHVGPIAAPVGDQAFLRDENRFQQQGLDNGGTDGNERRPQQCDEQRRLFDAPPDVEQHPTQSTGHAPHVESGEGHQIGDQLIQVIVNFDQRGKAPRRQRAPVLLEIVDDAPGVDGPEFAHGVGGLSQHVQC